MIKQTVIVLCLIGTQCSPGLSGASESNDELPRNRIDFTTVYFDTVDTDRFTGILDYTRNLSPSSNLGVRATYLDSRFGVSGGTGWGDTTVTYSYLPRSQMSVGPWIPRIVGSGISISLPTGNENQGRGLGGTIVTPFIGTRVPLSDSISFAPTLAYAYSTDQIITGKDVRVALLDLGLTWVGKSGWWAAIFVGYIKDYESNNTSTGGRLSFGKVFANRWGFSAHLIDLECFRPGLLPPQDNQFDQVYELSLQYGF